MPMGRQKARYVKIVRADHDNRGGSSNHELDAKSA